MKKKRGLCMAAGGLIGDVDESARRRAEIAAKYGVTTGESAPAPQPPASPPAPAPAPAPQRRGGLTGAFDALTNRKRQIEGAAGYAQGGIVRGPGGPEDDEVPMQIAGKDVRLSNTEAVLPARTVQALGGPEAVEALIEQTNGKPPVKGGLRQGGKYYSGTSGDTINPKELRPEFRGNAAGQPVTPAANAGAQAMQNTAAQTHMNKMPDVDPVRAQQAAQVNAQANAAAPKLETPRNPNVGAGKVSPEAQAFKAGQGATTGAASIPPLTQTGGSALKQTMGLLKGTVPVSAAVSAIAGAAEPDSTKRYATRFGMDEPTGDGSAGDIAKFIALRGLGAASDVASGATFGLADKLFRDKQQVDTGMLGGALGGAAGWKGAEVLGRGIDALGTMVTKGRYKGNLGQKLLGNTATKAVAATAGSMAGAELGADENSKLSSENLLSMLSQTAASQTKAGENPPVGETVVEGPRPDGPQEIDPVTKLPVGLAAAAKANDGPADFNATMDATKYNPPEGTGVITRAPGKDGLRSGTFIGGPSAADAARDAKFEAAGYGKDAYGNWMTPQRQALQQAGKEWEERNYRKQAVGSLGPSALSNGQQGLLKKALTPYEGAPNGQLTANQINAARGIMQDAQNGQLKAAEIAQSGENARLAYDKRAGDGKPGFRDLLEAQKFQYQIGKDREQSADRARNYLSGRIDKHDEKVGKILDTYSTVDGKVDPQKRSIVEKFMANFDKTYEGAPEQYFAELEDWLAIERVLEAQGRSGFTNWGERRKPWSGDITTGIKEVDAPWYRVGDSKLWEDEYGRRYGSEIEKQMTPKQWEIFKTKYLKQQQQQRGQ